MKLNLSLRRKKDSSDDDAAEVKSPRRATGQSASGGAKEWLFLHVEKVALCGVLVLAGWLVYTSIGKLKLDKNKTPQALQAQVLQVDSRLQNSPFPEEQFPIPNYSQQVDRGREPVLPGMFRWAIGQGSSGPQLRPDPELLPVEQVEARAGVGIFFVREGGVLVEAEGEKRPLPKNFLVPGVAPPEGAKNQVKRWVAINSVLSLAKQQHLFDDAFKNSVGFDAKRDVPQYLAATYQRIEIPPGGSTGELDWSKATELSFRDRVQGLTKERRTWALTAPEIVDAAFVQRPNQGAIGVLTEPLGPLALRSWLPWAPHSKTPVVVVAPTPPPRGGNRRRRPAVVRPKAPVVAAAPAPVVEPVGDAGIFGDPEGPADPEIPEAAPEKQADPVEPEIPASAQFKLVRIFDYSVQPGKSYRYRVKLAIYNPNRTYVRKEEDGRIFVPVRRLVNKASGASLYHETGWSDPSPVVYVPQDAQLFAGPIVPPSDERPGEAAEVLVKILKQGQELAAKFVLRRGAVARGLSSILGISSDRKSVITQKEVAIATEYTLLDIHGGASMSEDLASPTELLFMDARGNLIVRTSDDDKPELTAFGVLEKTANAPVRRKPRGRGLGEDEDEDDDIIFGDGPAEGRGPGRGPGRSRDRERPRS